MLVVVNVDSFMIQKQAKGLVTSLSVDVLFYVFMFGQKFYIWREQAVFCFVFIFNLCLNYLFQNKHKKKTEGIQNDLFNISEFIIRAHSF